MGVTWTKDFSKILALAIAWEQKQEKKQNEQEATAVTKVRDNGGLTQNDVSGDESHGQI